MDLICQTNELAISLQDSLLCLQLTSPSYENKYPSVFGMYNWIQACIVLVLIPSLKG